MSKITFPQPTSFWTLPNLTYYCNHDHDHVPFRDIGRIDLVNGIFQTKVEIFRLWNDQRVFFLDLNEDQENYFDSDSSDMIWFPWIEFLNIARKVQ